MPSLDTMVSYHRLKKAPLDDMEVFIDLRSLMDYCKDGASYDGQRVVVLNDTFGAVEYCIKNNIPMINMRGSEPIFKTITFDGDAVESHGMLIYENNKGGIWKQNEVFSFHGNRLCLISQLEIFRILDASGLNSFKFYMERIDRSDPNGYFNRIDKWTQYFNPYDDGEDNSISYASPGASITAISFYKTDDAWLKSENSKFYLMPSSANSSNQEDGIITRIYVKAEEYYKAWNGVE